MFSFIGRMAIFERYTLRSHLQRVTPGDMGQLPRDTTVERVNALEKVTNLRKADPFAEKRSNKVKEEKRVRFTSLAGRFDETTPELTQEGPMMP